MRAQLLSFHTNNYTFSARARKLIQRCVNVFNLA
uniref:Uncharacterized protein n=1 Tax=Anguilla anguilla TaxID=7936 RepID=A0A0E9RDP0_ANGAN